MPARSLPDTGLAKERPNLQLWMFVNTTGIKPMPMQITAGRRAVIETPALSPHRSTSHGR